MSWISKLLYGVDLDEEQARGTDLDNQLRADAAASLANGRYDQAAFDQASQHINEGAIDDVNGDVTQAFYDGLDQGAANIRGAVGGAVGLTGKLIPWQVWAIGGVVLFVYMMGGLKGILKR